MNSCAKLLLIVAFITAGSINTLVTKFEFQTCSLGLNADPSLCPAGQKAYHKPWTQNFCMFFTEAWFYALHMRKRRLAKRLKPDFTPSLNKKAAVPQVPFYIFLFPASCDVLGTGLGGVGLMYISASVWQMMRGSLIVFTSLLSVLCLRRQLYAYNYIAVFIAICGLMLVGYSALLDEGESSSNVGLGIVITIMAQLFGAMQMVLQELFLKSYHAPVEQCVGSEGLWGICIMVISLSVMYHVPGKDAGSFENVFDSYEMLTNNTQLLCLVLVYMATIGTYNFIGLTISKHLSALHRTINDSLRVASVWGVQLFLFSLGNKVYGIGLKPHSWMQLLGFVLLIIASVVNHMIVRIPYLFYPDSTGGRLRPMGMMMSPTHQGVSVLSYPGSPAASPLLSPASSLTSPVQSPWSPAQRDHDNYDGEEISLVEESELQISAK